MEHGEAQGQRRPEVREWLDNLKDAVVRASEVQKKVFERLEHVMRSVDRPNEEVEKSAELVPLANELRHLMADVEETTEKYEEMLKCLEL